MDVLQRDRPVRWLVRLLSWTAFTFLSVAPVQVSPEFAFSRLSAQENPALQTPAPEEPLHRRIDAFLAQVQVAPPAGAVADGLLLRRLYLDLIGVPPTIDELQAYQQNSDPNKYPSVIAALLDRPEFVEHWVKQLDLALMERRANTQVPLDNWEAFLRESIAAKEPLNQLFAKILSADGAPGASRAAARFYLDRGSDPHLITRDVGRVFLGRDMQCAQCHDHPLIDSYYQSDYHGLLAFFSGGFNVEVADGDKKVIAYAEKSNVEAPFESVFDKGNAHRSLPKLLGQLEAPQPAVIPGEDYAAAPGDGKISVPHHSRRKQLAQLATSGGATAFNENWANRLWSNMFGRGLVHPVDLHHAENPSLHPDLLRHLGASLASMNFDLRRFLNELALTEAYRRGEFADVASMPLQSVAEIEAKVTQFTSDVDALKAKGLQEAKLEAEARNQLAAIEKQRLELLAKIDAARTAMTAAIDAVNKATAEKGQADAALQAARDKAAKLQGAADATTAAKGAIPEDAELAKASELLVQKVAAFQATLAPLEKAVTDKQAVVDAAVAARDQSRVPLVDLYAQVEPVSASYRVQEQLVLNARSEKEKTWQAEAVSNARLTVEKMALKALKTKEQQQSLLAARESLLAQEAVDKQKLTDSETRLAAMESALVFAANEVTMSTEQLQVAQQALATTTEQVNQLSSAQGALTSVISLAGNTPSMTETLKELEAKKTEFTTQQSMLAAKRDSIAAELQQRQATMATKQMEKEVAATEKQNLLTQWNKSTELLISNERETQSAQQTYSQQLLDLAAKRAERFEQSRLVALTPEQFCWSLLSATGVFQRHLDAKLAELNKNSPLTEQQLADPAQVEARQRQAFQLVRNELRGNVQVFIQLYGAAPGQPQSDFFATADQALYANNGGAFFGWGAAAGGNPTHLALNATDPTESAKFLYLGFLGREPNAAEIEEVRQYLAQVPDKKAQLLQELAWGLLTSAEFRFNH